MQPSCAAFQAAELRAKLRNFADNVERCAGQNTWLRLINYSPVIEKRRWQSSRRDCWKGNEYGYVSYSTGQACTCFEPLKEKANTEDNVGTV